MISEGLVPDLLLLDVLMPGMNGFEACRILRRKHRLEHLPIIMLTALDDQMSIDEAYRCGATDFITKPLNIPLLPHRIRYLLRSAMAIRELFDSQITLINTADRPSRQLDDGCRRQHHPRSREYLDIVGLNQLPVPERRLLPRVHREDRTTLRSGPRCAWAGPTGSTTACAARWKTTSGTTCMSAVSRASTSASNTSGPKVSPRTFPNASPRKKDSQPGLARSGDRTQQPGPCNRVARPRCRPARQPASAVDGLHLPGNLRDVQTVLGQEIADAAIRALAGRLKGMLEHPGEDCTLDADCLQQVKLAR
jgi:CheY-like chemotaxis protein